MKYDFMVVGSGMFGATCARLLTNKGYRCLVIDKKPHVAGACYSYNHGGIEVHAYGAHIFHTNSDKVWEFVNRFGKFNTFTNRVKAIGNDGKVYSFPINLKTLNEVWGVVTPEDAIRRLHDETKIYQDRTGDTAENFLLKKIGSELYYKFFYDYTRKQYFREPKELPASIVQRLKYRLTYDDNYFDTKYQGIPTEGYTNLVSNILYGIPTEISTDFYNMDWSRYAKKLLYTGPVDKFFSYDKGELEYNTLDFRMEQHNIVDYQGNAVFNFCGKEPYIRRIEHKHFTGGHNLPFTVVSYDIPLVYNKETTEPLYPIRTQRNIDLYEEYAAIKKAYYPNVFFGGRIGSYVYYDMDQAIASAMTLVDKICES